MNAKEVLCAVMRQAGFTQAQLAGMVGLKSQSSFSMAMSRADLKVGFLVRVLNAMGYEVVIKKRKPGRREDGVFILSNDASVDE